MLNKTVSGVDLGDSGGKALVKEGRHDRFATSGKRSILKIVTNNGGGMLLEIFFEQ